MIACQNCGASFADDAARCPYCGALNPAGAEAAYMAQLEDLREGTDQLDDDVRHDLEADVRHSASFALKATAIAAAVIIALLFIVRILDL